MNAFGTTVIATHSGPFHADDAFGVAVLRELHPAAAIVRTRDPSVIARATYAVDVGGVWDPSQGRFNHHQKGFVGARPSGVVYASAGLVWAEHGQAMIQRSRPELSALRAAEIQRAIDDDLVQHLDMADTGAAQGAPGYFGLSALISAFNTTNSEDLATQGTQAGALAREAVTAKMDLQFLAAVDIVRVLLARLIEQHADQLAGCAKVRTAERVFDGKVLLLPESGLSWSKVVCEEMPDVLFVVYPDSTDDQYQIRTVPVEPESFKARRDLPAGWAGLRDEALASETGVTDAVFCHNARFIAGAVTRTGALRLAEMALLKK